MYLFCDPSQEQVTDNFTFHFLSAAAEMSQNLPKVKVNFPCAVLLFQPMFFKTGLSKVS